MKTIEEMYQEWLRGQIFVNDLAVSDSHSAILALLRRAFFAGFNEAYCVCNDALTINEYEKEMDEFSDARDEGRV